jgi:hypothetical protein
MYKRIIYTCAFVDVIIASVLSYLNKSYFYVFEQRNIFFYVVTFVCILLLRFTL